MTCNCKAEMEAKLNKHVKDTTGANDAKVDLCGYGIVMGASELKLRPFMVYKGQYTKPGAGRIVTTSGNMFFNYCPFCGIKLEATT